LAVIEGRLSAIFEKDVNSGDDGKYQIHSLYFDDVKDSCAKENDAGISRRFKYRIRYYGENPDFMKLERKEKWDGRCHKEACMLTISEYEEILAGKAQDLFWETDKKLLKEFCVHVMTRGFIPKAIIDYERIAYVEEITNIRITLDTNISVSDDVEHFLDGDYLKYPLQDKDQHVLEVKFDYILPGYVKSIVTKNNLVQSSFSKYYLGRIKLQRMGRLG
jgi:hypothetical protein